MKTGRIIPLLFIAGLTLGFNTGVMAEGERYQAKKPVGSLELRNAKPKSTTRAPRAPSSPRAFATKQGGGNKAVAYCWTVSECNEMISNCISVGGTFITGITDMNTGATSEGSCSL